jgi:hypothetical protein
VGELSRLEQVHIENASHGIRIENFQAPSIVDVTFDDITNSRHIYLADSDAMIPSGYYETSSCVGTFHEVAGVWDLDPGTHVLTSTNDEENPVNHDLACAGESTLVDIFVGGMLSVNGAENDMVFFKPENPTDPSSEDAGRDWGGIFLSFYSEDSSIEYADIGYAANPVHLFYPTDQVIANSRIHHFAETGVWAYGLGGSDGPYFENLRVERGDLEETLGDTGVLIDHADATDIIDSLIDLDGRHASTRSTGIDLYYFSPALGSTRDFRMEGNCIQGPGMGAEDGGESDIGVNADYVRAGSLLDVHISGNKIDGWK